MTERTFWAVVVALNEEQTLFVSGGDRTEGKKRGAVHFNRNPEEALRFDSRERAEALSEELGESFSDEHGIRFYPAEVREVTRG